MRRVVVVGAFVLVSLVAVPELPARAVPGGRVWVRRYNDPFNGRDIASSVKVSADNFRVFVAGTSWQGAARGNDYVTIAYSRAGAWLWARRYNGPGSGDDHVAGLARSPDGSRIFVTGSSYGGPGWGINWATVAYDSATGKTLWIRRHASVRGYDAALAIAASPDGKRVYVTGVSSGNSHYEYGTIAYNAATGATIWAKRYDSGCCGAIGLAVSSDSTRVYVTGDAVGGWTTVAYDSSSGTQLWVQQYNPFGDCGSNVAAIAVSRDGNRLYITGSVCNSEGESSTDTVAYDRDGNQVWVQSFSSYGGNVIGVSPDGNRIFVGAVGGIEACDSSLICTVAYAKDGTELWETGYGEGNCTNGPTGLVVSKDGARIYLSTGTNCDNGNYATLAYSSSSGGPLWTHEYNGPGKGQDIANGLALSPDGLRLYVTGGSWGGWATRYDYATIAYNTT